MQSGFEQHPAEQRTEQRRTEAAALAADLSHDVDDTRPGHMAAMIINASRKAHGDAELPTGLAADIIRAGKLARGEIVADAPALPENPMAKAVILSGRRARGEALSAADEAWLQGYCKKLEDARRR